MTTTASGMRRGRLRAAAGAMLRIPGYAARIARAGLRHRVTAMHATLAFRPRNAPAGGRLFQCNICGAHSSAPDALLRDREAPTCHVCSSSQRYRALIAALQSRLTGEVVPLRRMRPRTDLVGLGMSDAGVYAEWLARRFRYTNTFFHTTPYLDIQHPDPRYLGRQDFVVSSDVMEHVVPPVADAFVHLRALLKPGGVLALTVPYGVHGPTVEHFPELDDFRIEDGGRRLVNRTLDGREQVFEHVCFHGGDGATLEMRVFALPDLLRLLEAAGFTDIRVHDEALPSWGILVDTPCSLPITAIARPVEPASTTAMR